MRTNRNLAVQIEEQSIKAVPSVESLSTKIDDKPSFNLHISKIYNSEANQLDATTRLRSFMTFNVKEALINSYFMSTFNYCPLLWMFSSIKSLNRIENLQKRALRFLPDYYEPTYEQLLNKAGRSSMSINRLRTLCVEICETSDELNLSFMKNIFMVKETDSLTREQCKTNLNTPSYNQMTFGYKSLCIYGPKIWNKLPYHIKLSENLRSFKELIKSWDGTRCSCKICK